MNRVFFIKELLAGLMGLAGWQISATAPQKHVYYYLHGHKDGTCVVWNECYLTREERLEENRVIIAQWEHEKKKYGLYIAQKRFLQRFYEGSGISLPEQSLVIL